MVIKEKEFFEYLKCPLRYVMLTNGADIDGKKSVNQFIYSVVKHMYIHTLDNPISNPKIFQNKWDSICPNNREIINPKNVIEGWGLIYRAYEYVKYNNIRFMDVDMQYNLEIPGTGVTLIGQLDPIIDKGDHIEVLISSFSKKLPEKIDIDTKLKHTIDAYVLHQMFKKDVIIKYHSYPLNKDIYTLRNKKDYDRLETIIKNVGIAISNNIIYPRDTYMCSSCVAREMCRAWTGK
jgi:hypothetical protein